MKASSLTIFLNAVLLAGLHAQGRGDVPLMRPEEEAEVKRQTVEFFDAIRPASRDAVQSTVWVWADTTGRGKRPVVYGTVIGDGTKVLTKWSEIAMHQGTIQVVGGDGTTAKATVLGVYQEDDLALLQLEGARFRAIEFVDREAPKLGRFLIAASPDDTPASVGVVAVEARSLRVTDQAFLGVMIDHKYVGKGVKVQDVDAASAAMEAGLKPDDVILSVGERAVRNLIDVQTALAGHGPGDRITIRFLRNGGESTVEAVLKEKSADFPQIPNGRLRQMERMGTELSLVRSGFPSVIQTDMQLDRDRCGGPVVDLDGKLVGIAIARSDRTRSFVTPVKSIIELLAKNPVSPEVAQAAIDEEREAPQQVGQRAPAPDQMPRAMPAPDPEAADRMRKNLEDMQLLIERMREEMQGIGE
jgi:S1-C subfamily serine protease